MSEHEHQQTRRQFLHSMGGALAYASLGMPEELFGKNKHPLNIMLITADDLNCDDLGCYGGQVKGLTPNLDALAKQGMRFENAHVNIGICMPSRIALATGLYAHNSGAMGFMHAPEGTQNVVELFQDAGYNAGILGKTRHSTAHKKITWDYVASRNELGDGRSPKKYVEHCKNFFDLCKKEKKPFYFMVNSHDPHRPFQKPGNPTRGAERPSKLYKPNEVDVPGFLPDLPKVRLELSYYLNSVKRMDDTVGAVLKALRETGQEKNTLVIFMSDNGIATPFAKCNCYLAGTRTPWIVRWPGVVKANTVNEDDFISNIDFLPTMLEAAGLQKLKKQDGRSYIPLLRGKKQDGREWVYTQIDSKAGGSYVPMRCVQNKQFGYIFNGWSDGKTSYRNNNEGLCMRAMEEAAKTDAAIAARVKTFRIRVQEEMYDLENDPDCLHNLADDPKYAKVKQALIKRLEQYMLDTNDGIHEAFVNRHDPKKLRPGLAKAKRAGSHISCLKTKEVRCRNKQAH